MTMIPTFFLNILLVLIHISIINGSHFLGGTITWRLQNTSSTGTPVAIIITQTYSWTYTSAICTASMIATNQLVPTSAGSLICLPTCPSGFGTVPATPFCTDVSPLNGITVGQRSDTVNVTAGSNFVVAFQGSAWGTLTAGGSTWSITSRINLILRSDNGKYNNAPVSTMMSPINIQLNETKVITVPTSDSDGDVIRCRWATSSNGVDECASVCPPSSLPANTTIYPNCTIVITGYVIGTKFAVTLMVEDFMNSTSTTPLSSVPVQFLVKVIAPLSCLYRPEIILLAESCTPLKVNQTFTSTLLAINHCGTNVNISDIATLSFSGMILSSLTMLNSTVYYKNLTWTPSIKQLGYQVMCAMALDSQNSQSSQYCFTFYVTEDDNNVCPGIVYNTTSTILTASIISTTTSSIIQTDSNNWPLIGGLSALALLIALTISCCLVCRYYKRSAVNRRRKSYMLFKTNKKHDNESTIESNSSSKSAVNARSATTKSHVIQMIPDDKTISSPIPQTPILNANDNDSNEIISNDRHSSRKPDNHIQRKLTSTTSLPKSKPIEIASNVSNITPKQERKKDLSRINSYENTHDKVVRINFKAKRRSNSFHQKTSQKHHVKKTLGRRSSAGDIDFLRVTHINSKLETSKTPPIDDDIRPSIIENTIHLDHFDRNTHLPHSVKTVVSHALRTTGEPRPSTIDTIKLTPTISKKDTTIVSPDNNETQPSSIIRVEHVKTGKKRPKITTAIVPLKPLVEEQKNTNENISGSNVTVEHVPKEKRRHD